MWKPFKKILHRHQIFGYLPIVIKGNLAWEMKVTFCNNENALHAGLLCCQNTHSEVMFMWGHCDTPPWSPWDKRPRVPASESLSWTAFSCQFLQGMLQLQWAILPKVMSLAGQLISSGHVMMEYKDLTIWLWDNPKDHPSSRAPHGLGQGFHRLLIRSPLLPSSSPTPVSSLSQVWIPRILLNKYPPH